MLISHSVQGCPDQPMLVFGSPHHRQDREERRAETTADVQERSRVTTATRQSPTLPEASVGRAPRIFGPSGPRASPLALQPHFIGGAAFDVVAAAGPGLVSAAPV